MKLALVGAVILGAGILNSAPAAATERAGFCLFGHSDPRNRDSSCRYSGEHPQFTPADPDGYPDKRCGPGNDGERVVTWDAEHKMRIMICSRVEYMGHHYWWWQEEREA